MESITSGSEGPRPELSLVDAAALSIWLVLGIAVVGFAPRLAGCVRAGLAGGTLEATTPSPATEPLA
ncbi:MAG TPA: hypothetical protein VG293_02410 [Solirubrobacteraceae bacterium]|jgi:hypothetical protein|nr:hypothetical protein [Solirubrobacteraceae bacterium]